MPTHEEITAVVEPVVVARGFDLESVKLRAAGRHSQLIVIVDADVVDSDGLAEVSRDVSEALDATDVMGDAAYTLEVSSRGVDAPLTLPRHWRRNVGRLVQVSLTSGGQVDGRIESADEDSVVIAGETVDLGDVAKARVQVEFTEGGR